MPTRRDRDRSDALAAAAERTPSLAQAQALMQRADELRRDAAGKGKAARLPFFRN